MRKNSILNSPLWLALLVAAAVLSPFVVTTLGRPPFPEGLGPLALQEAVSGNDARNVIERMHGKDVGAGENHIGFYGSPRGRAVVYVSLFSTRGAAQRAEQLMHTKIAHGNAAFSHYRTVRLEGEMVGSCVGLGQVHFFFAEGSGVYWLAVDPPLAEPVLRALVLGTR